MSRKCTDSSLINWLQAKDRRMEKETKAVPDSVLWMDPCEMYGVPFEPTEVEADGSFVIDVAANKAMNEAEYRWTRAIMEEPVMSALKGLSSRQGVWVGDEARLYEEVKRFTAPELSGSGSLPSGPEELVRHIEDINEYTCVLPQAGLEVLDQRKLRAEEAQRYSVPGWNHDRPILIAREGAASRRALFYEAMFRLARHEKPLLVAALKSTRKQRHWSGATWELRMRLAKYYPDARSDWFPWKKGIWERYPDGGPLGPIHSEDYLYDGDFDPYRIVDRAFGEWIGPKGHFSGHPKDLDPLGIYKLMVRYIPILDKLGVKVTCKKPSSKEKTRWTIEGPAWDFGDLERIIARLWFEQHTDGSARDQASNSGTLKYRPI